jgi:hypothetical protein
MRKNANTQLGNNEDSRDRLKQVLRDYFDIPLLPGTRERRVLFLHSTFKEYLMAENYLEILLTKDDNSLSPSWMKGR